MTMIVAPVIIRSSPPTHETEDRCFIDDAGREISVSVRAKVGAGTAKPFTLLPVAWKRDLRSEEEMSPFEVWGISLLAVFVIGIIIFFSIVILGVAGWLPHFEPRDIYEDQTIAAWRFFFSWYAKGAVVIAGGGFVIACLAALFTRKK